MRNQATMGTGEQSETLPGSVPRRVLRCRDGARQTADDLIAAEIPVAFFYNDDAFAVMMATPDDLRDFALGFSLSEGLIEHAGELRIDAIDASLEGIALRLRVPAERMTLLDGRRRNLHGRSGCGLCGTASIDAVLRPPLPIAADTAFETAALARALHALRERQPLNALTGATHAAGWSDADGNLLLVREDVGRHNALDKLIGALIGECISPASGFAVVTSRASYEMAMKAAQVGIPLLAAISAPTALAIALAESAMLTLVGFARDDGHVVYTHPQRLIDDHGPATP